MLWFLHHSHGNIIIKWKKQYHFCRVQACFLSHWPPPPKCYASHDLLAQSWNAMLPVADPQTDSGQHAMLAMWMLWFNTLSHEGFFELNIIVSSTLLCSEVNVALIFKESSGSLKTVKEIIQRMDRKHEPGDTGSTHSIVDSWKF